MPPPASSLWKRLVMSVPAASSIAVGVKKTVTSYEVNAEVPGFKKEDIQLSFSENGHMSISAERREERTKNREDQGELEGERHSQAPT